MSIATPATDAPLLTQLRALPLAEQSAQANQWLGAEHAQFFAELLRYQPILNLPGLAIATRFDDVEEVLRHDDVFSVQLYAPRMERLTGAFILGMADGPQYEREQAILRLAAGRGDLERIRTLIKKAAADCVAAVAHSGRIDVVNDLGRAVPAVLVREYFGVSGPDDTTLKRWLRALFWDIFLNLSNAPAVSAAALAASAEVKAFLTASITATQAALKKGETVPDTVLTRLVKLGGEPETALSTADIIRNIGGLIIGAQETTAQALAQAVDQLVDRPELAGARAAATAGGDLQNYLFEALRFFPQNPFVYRICTRNFTLAAGTPRETTIPAGTFVVAATSSAMLDPDAFEAPQEFKLGRPADRYMLFGYGLHTCFGKYINGITIPEIARPLLALPNLRRAEGAAGKIAFDNTPFPNSFTLLFDEVPAMATTTPEAALPKLITIPPSLGCEGARWILEYSGIPYVEESHAVLEVGPAVQRAGGTDFPALQTASKTYSANYEIAPYAEEHALPGRCLKVAESHVQEEKDLAAAIIQLGTHSANWGYFYLLPQMALMIPVFSKGIPEAEKAYFTPENYPKTAGAMTQSLKLSAENAAESLAAGKQIFALVGKRLAEGVKFLADGHFTLMDLLFASQAAPFVFPPEYGGTLPPLEQLPAEMKSVISTMRQTAAGQFALRMYREERNRYCSKLG